MKDYNLQDEEDDETNATGRRNLLSIMMDGWLLLVSSKSDTSSLLVEPTRVCVQL